MPKRIIIRIYLNKDGYTIFEIFQRTQDRYEVVEELKRRNMSIDEKSVHDFLANAKRQFMEIIELRGLTLSKQEDEE